LEGEGLIKTKKVEEVMRRIDRGDFAASLKEAYSDSPHSIGNLPPLYTFQLKD
jgi:protein-L-isoaspartate O-methyltransferase